ncbi:flagellar filament capping protein FliD [Herbaspirillum camelliae]|uniref:flagellar filament capping protein FliD n=1 Tax=Herbaspirillum camelliae TaxID=1892903 RepID=UPI00094A0373|nr:flagellar filament capping protein FliD [Herbaspirillum camelliae]
MPTSTGSISTSAGPLDVATLVSQLISVESKAQLTPLTTKASGINALISGYGNLKSALTTYQSALKGLTAASFSSQKAALTNAGTGTNLTTDPFTADINTDSSTKVLAQKLQSGGFAQGQTFNAGDTIAIKVGTNQPTFVTLKANATLAGVRDAINAGNTGVTASIVSDGSGDHLVFEANTGGTANTIKLTANNSLSSLFYDASSTHPSSVTQLQAPRDASKAASGQYAIAVSQLAQAQKVSSTGIAPGTTFDNGILAIKTGTGSTAIIKPTTNTLAGVRDAINASDAGVNASIISDGTNDHLVVTAKDSGAANTLRISGTGNFSMLSFDPSGTLISPSFTTGQTYNAGSLTLQAGGQSVTINPTDLDGNGSIGLNDVMKAINNANANVTASITSSGGQDHLVLAPSGTSPISLVGAGDYANLSGSSMGQLAKAQDAHVSIDGVAVTSSSNKVADAISGVTLNLAKVTNSNDNFSLAITNDNSGVSTAANTFVNSYNTLAKTISSMTAQKPSTTLGAANTSAPLGAESSVQNIINQLRNTLMTSMGTTNGTLTLSQIGISFQKDGTLALDSAKLTTATNANFDGISTLLTSTNGVIPKLQTLMDSILSDTGIIATKTNGLQNSLKINTDQQTAVNARLTRLKDTYTNQFNKLNVTLSSMQSTQSYLTQQLGKLVK